MPEYMVTSAGATYRLVSDQVGSVRMVVDTSSGAVVERIDWDEFGDILNDSAPGLQPFGFAGGLQDLDSGLTRLGARDYNPVTGRWTAKDPLKFAGAASNLFAYAGADPLNFVDPSGLTIIVPPSGAADYWSAVAYLRRDPGMKKVIDELNASDTVYNIVFNSVDNDAYDPNTHSIFWDPHSALRCLSGGTQSPALGLGHEMGHANAGFWDSLIGWIPSSPCATGA